MIALSYKRLKNSHGQFTFQPKKNSKSESVQPLGNCDATDRHTDTRVQLMTRGFKRRTYIVTHKLAAKTTGLST